MVQKKISDLLKDRILVGHSVQNDLKVLYTTTLHMYLHNIVVLYAGPSVVTS